jgi:hypothetical protein
MKYQIIVTNKNKSLIRMTFDNLDFAKDCFARLLPELQNIDLMELQEVKVISSARNDR